jgi:energy-coupling factor transporter ATP-binding protein EcfA2
MFLKDLFFKAARNVNIRFKVPNEDIINDDVMLKLGAYIPDIRRMDNAPWKCDLTFLLADGAPYLGQGQDKGEHCVVMAAPKSRQEMPEDVYHLLYAAVRKVMIEQKDLPIMHAACVVKEGRARLITGVSGSGKTTLTQSLIDDEGYQLVSGNKTVLDFVGGSLHALSGTKTMTILDCGFNRAAYDLPIDQVAEDNDYPVTSIDIVRLNDGVEECETLSQMSALHTLYPLVMDNVNKDVIVGGQFLFDGEVSAKAKNDITQRLSRVVRNIPVRKISGSRAFIQRQFNG